MSTAASFHPHALMTCVAWLAQLFTLLHAVAQAAAEAVFIGGDRVQHAGRVMSYGLEPRGEFNSNALTGGVRANTSGDARKKELSKVAGRLDNSSTTLLIIIGVSIPLSLLAIWVLSRMRKCPAGPGNDPENQVDEHSPAAYPLRLVSPPPSPSGPGSEITPPPPAHQNGRNKPLSKTKTSYTSSLTSISASSTAPTKTGEAEMPHLPIFVRLKNKHKETSRVGAGRGEGGPLTTAEMSLTGVGILQPVEMPGA